MRLAVAQQRDEAWAQRAKRCVKEGPAAERESRLEALHQSFVRMLARRPLWEWCASYRALVLKPRAAGSIEQRHAGPPQCRGWLLCP